MARGTARSGRPKRRTLRNAVALLIGLAATVAITVPAQAAIGTGDDVVRTPNGAVRGTVTDDHRAFLGIPYAAPPVGDLRWRAPRPAEPWSGVRDATTAGAPCPQSPHFPDDPPVVGSEDCLSVNVDTPRGASGPLPVLVFLHGGGFIGGQGAPYEPSRITERGVIVVTLNYRLGALGFLRHPSMRDPYAGNFGVADQQAALRWVRGNIAAFGGDPRNVTLWGESAGAFSVCAHLASPTAHGLFHKAIVQSGPCGNALLTREESERRGRVTATDLGCTDPAHALECLRRKPLTDLVGLGEEGLTGVRRYQATLPWLPVAGTAAVPVQPLTALRHGPGVPLIHGGTRDEVRPFVARDHDGQGRPLTAERYPGAVRDLYGAESARKIVDRYPADAYPSPGLALATLLGDEGRFLGSCSQLPALDAAARRAPVYAYEFAEPSTETIGEFPLGAYHGYDVRQMFGGRFPQGQASAVAQSPVGDTLIRFWTDFARTGDPGPEWPRYRDGTVLSITAGGTVPVDLAREHRCAFWRGIPG
ncbi:MAG: carboxylesterase family protein [Streptosporangiales bacterium]|nr:carboxylesterase family protein [Streptosporangiales bacterium]